MSHKYYYHAECFNHVVEYVATLMGSGEIPLANFKKKLK
jgi:hypothetical protein